MFSSRDVGALRLSRFRSDPARGNLGYTGLTITVNATWVAINKRRLSTRSAISPAFMPSASMGNDAMMFSVPSAAALESHAAAVAFVLLRFIERLRKSR